MAKCLEALAPQEHLALAATTILAPRALVRPHDHREEPRGGRLRAFVRDRGRGRVVTIEPTLEEGRRESSGLRGETKLVPVDRLGVNQPAGVPSAPLEPHRCLGRKEGLVLSQLLAGVLTRAQSEAPNR